MVLVDADAVHSGLGGIGQLIEGPVVVLAYFFGVGEFPERRVNPYGLVALLEVGGQVAVGHEVEHRDFHAVVSCEGRGSLLFRIAWARAKPQPNPLKTSKGDEGSGADCKGPGVPLAADGHRDIVGAR